MGAVPKRRISRGRRGRRRTHIKLVLPTLVECPYCHELKRPHHACPHCGVYRGMKVVEVEE